MERENDETIMENGGPASTETGETGQSSPFVTRRQIGSAVYEVWAHFSQSGRETLRDKILWLVRNEILNHRKGGH